MDIFVENHGSIVLLRPTTARARAWLHENLAPDAQYFGNAACAEPRYVGPIIDGLREDGLTVKEAL